MRDATLVCEGGPGGTDERVLQHALVNKLGVAVKIEPSGGSRTVGSVRQFIENSERRRGTRMSAPLVFSIEDRDYRPLDPKRALQSASEGQHSFVWTRHEIENYLLAPTVVLAMFGNLRRTVTQLWTTHLPGGLSDVTKILEKIARPLTVDHVGATVEKQLDSELLRCGAPEYIVAPKLKGSSSSAHRAEWIAALGQALERVMDGARARQEWAKLDVEAVFAAKEREIEESEYFAEGRHLVDFGGHELVHALWQYFSDLGAKGLKESMLEDELITAFEQAYEPGMFQPDEFQSLARRIQRATGAASV